jgi:small basic protein
MMRALPLMGLLAGILLGLVFSVQVPPEWARYTALAMLAAFDSVVGAWRADLDGVFESRIFISGFFVNMLLAAVLTLVGDRLGVDLSIAAIVVFGTRLFNNLAIIRRHIIK